MRTLAKITSGQDLSSGLFPSLLGEAAPLWKDGENVVFDNGGVRKSHGLTGLANLAATPTGLAATVAATEPRCFVGAGSSAYRYRSSDGLTEIATFASSGGRYQFIPWDTWVLISNGVNPLKLWKNTGSASAITAPFTYANTLFAHGTQVFAGGTSNGGQYVEWCSVNNIEDWTPTLANTASFLRLRDLQGDIVCAKKLGNSVGIYSQSNGGLFVYIGGTISYGFRRPISGVGAISPHSVVEAGDRHFGITQDNVFVTDLLSYTYIDEPAVRKWIQDNVDWDRLTEVYGWHDKSNSMIRWALPKNGGGFTGLGFRYDKGTWTRFNDGVICGEQSGAFANMFLAKTNRLLRQDKESVNNDGSAFASYVQTKPLDLGSRNQFKRLQKLSLDGEWSGTVNLSLAFTNHPNETPTFTITTPMANEIYPDQLGQQSEFVFLHMKIESTAAGADWKLSGAELFGEVTAYVS